MVGRRRAGSAGPGQSPPAAEPAAIIIRSSITDAVISGRVMRVFSGRKYESVRCGSWLGRLTSQDRAAGDQNILNSIEITSDATSGHVDPIVEIPLAVFF